MLYGYILICLNAEGVHGKRKVGNPWSRATMKLTYNMLLSGVCRAGAYEATVPDNKKVSSSRIIRNGLCLGHFMAYLVWKWMLLCLTKIRRKSFNNSLDRSCERKKNGFFQNGEPSLRTPTWNHYFKYNPREMPLGLFGQIRCPSISSRANPCYLSECSNSHKKGSKQ